MRSVRILLLLILVVGAPTAPAWAHGVVGNRFFPATLAIDDPFVADELSLPSVLHIKGPDAKVTSLGAELSKTITPNLGISIAADYNFISPNDPDEKSSDGFGNPELAIKYAFFKNAEHETVLSLGFAWEIGGAGQKSGGAE